jgi:formylmethanofuran dehydrogenase subunit E-like metal-binding protein
MKKQKETSTDYMTAVRQGMRFALLCILFFAVPICSACASSSKNAEDEYAFWKEVGVQASFKAVRMIWAEASRFNRHDCLALTNAGYAEIDGRATTGALDGLTRVLRVGRGNHSLVELQSASTSPLWFAVYDKKSGYVAYLEVDPAAVTEDEIENNTNLFSTAVAEQVNAEHLYANAAEYAAKFDSKIFNGNEFRVVTVANALSVGVPTTVVRSFELHDHYCPGVTSGILMAEYIKKNLPSEKGYFVQTIQPWCKEDALIVLLNATPGKRSYSTIYPTDADIASWAQWAQEASTVVYRYDSASDSWKGTALGFDWGEGTSCPDYGHSVMNKLCRDLEFVDQMDSPENFVTEVKNFDLPAGVHPKEYAGASSRLQELLLEN